MEKKILEVAGMDCTGCEESISKAAGNPMLMAPAPKARSTSP